MLGVGNAWRRDDAAGIEVVRRLGAVPALLAREYEGDAAGLINAWEEEHEVVLVDAVSSGVQPGTVHRLDPRSRPLGPELFRRSTHHLGVGEAVELARAIDRLPARIELLGIEGADFGVGQGLTSEVERAVEQVAAELERRYAPQPPNVRNPPE